MNVAGKTESLENLSRPGLGRVTIMALHGLFHLTEAVGVEVLLRLRQEFLLLYHRLPEFGVAHHRNREDLFVLVQELILAQNAEPQAFGNGNGALASLQLTAHDVEEGRLSGTVGTHESVARPRVELEGRAREERTVSVRFFEVRDGDHGRECIQTGGVQSGARGQLNVASLKRNCSLQPRREFRGRPTGLPIRRPVGLPDVDRGNDPLTLGESDRRPRSGVVHDGARLDVCP